MLLRKRSGLRAPGSGGTLGGMRWMLLASLVLGCAWTNKNAIEAERRERVERTPPIPVCSSSRVDDRSIVVSCDSVATERIEPDFRRINITISRDAAGAALSVGMPYVQEMGSGESRPVERTFTTAVDCDTVHTKILSSTTCTGGGADVRMVGWTVRRRYQFLSREEAEPRMAGPEALRPQDARALYELANQELARLDGRPLATASAR